MQASNPRIVSIQNGYDTKPYKLMSARIPEFLEKYPKDQYQIEIRSESYMSTQSDLIRLYEVAISAGKTPLEMGLPALADTNMMKFHASLIDMNGRVLETASSLRTMHVYKDWEIGESAARQRLLAALGFGGDVFDSDEQADMADQGLNTSSPAQAADKVSVADGKSVAQIPKSKTMQIDEEESTATTSSESKAAETADAAVATEQTAEATAAEEEVVTTEATESQKGQPEQSSTEATQPAAKVPDHIMRKLVHTCKLKGIEVPEPRDAPHAKRLIKDIMADTYKPE